MKQVIRQEYAREKKKGYKLITVIVLVLFVVVACKSYSLYQELASLRKEYSSLQEQKQDEEERTELLEEEYARRQTLSYFEELAREKLGLVFPEDIIIRKQEEEE